MIYKNGGIKLNNNSNSKKKKFPIWAIILIVLGGLAMLSSLFSNGLDSDPKDSSKEETANTVATIYDDGIYIFKIMEYDEGLSTETIKIKAYLENNSDESISFTLEKPISIDGFTVDGGYLYEEIAPKTKKNVEINVYGLSKNNLKSTSVKEISFGLSIYKSENMIIKKRIVDNQRFKYEFKR